MCSEGAEKKVAFHFGTLAGEHIKAAPEDRQTRPQKIGMLFH